VGGTSVSGKEPSSSRDHESEMCVDCGGPVGDDTTSSIKRVTWQRQSADLKEAIEAARKAARLNGPTQPYPRTAGTGVKAAEALRRGGNFASSPPPTPPPSLNMMAGGGARAARVLAASSRPRSSPTPVINSRAVALPARPTSAELLSHTVPARTHPTRGAPPPRPRSPPAKSPEAVSSPPPSPPRSRTAAAAAASTVDPYGASAPFSANAPPWGTRGTAASSPTAARSRTPLAATGQPGAAAARLKASKAAIANRSPAHSGRSPYSQPSAHSPTRTQSTTRLGPTADWGHGTSTPGLGTWHAGGGSGVYAMAAPSLISPVG